MIRRTAVLVAVVLLSTALPATAAPKFTESRVYTQCTNATRIGNVNAVLFNQHADNWFTGKPIESFSDGEGCGVIDPIGLEDDNIYAGSVYDMIWAGTFTGNLETIVVHANVMGTVPVDVEIGVQLVIEGKDVATLDRTRVRRTVTQDLSTEVAVTRLEFAFTGLQLSDFGDHSGFTQRNVRLRLHAVDPVTPTLEWVWGATEALSGLTFNGDVGTLPVVPTDTTRLRRG